MRLALPTQEECQRRDRQRRACARRRLAPGLLLPRSRVKFLSECAFVARNIARLLWVVVVLVVLCGWVGGWVGGNAAAACVCVCARARMLRSEQAEAHVAAVLRQARAQGSRRTQDIFDNKPYSVGARTRGGHVNTAAICAAHAVHMRAVDQDVE